MLKSLRTWLARLRKDYKERGDCHLGNYESFWYRISINPWRWAISLCHFEDHWALHLFCLWITLWKSRSLPKDDMLDSWGFSFSFVEKYLHLKWGHRCKILYMPWMYDYCRVELLILKQPELGFKLDNYDWIKYEPINIYRETFLYNYAHANGLIQVVDATITVERRTWCWCGRPFRWIRWPFIVTTAINVEFDDEVGEERGSWKGGTIGCGWDMLVDKQFRLLETPEQCLRRMEVVRKFSR